ncbi:hypothetical protein FKM82_011758 [Ascaphus truei]
MFPIEDKEKYLCILYSLLTFLHFGGFTGLKMARNGLEKKVSNYYKKCRLRILIWKMFFILKGSFKSIHFIAPLQCMNGLNTSLCKRGFPVYNRVEQMCQNLSRKLFTAKSSQADLPVENFG